MACTRGFRLGARSVREPSREPTGPPVAVGGPGRPEDPHPRAESRVEHRSLSADPSIVDGRGGVDVGAEIEQQADSFQTLVLSRHVQSRGAFQRQHATASRPKIQLRESAMEKSRVGGKLLAKTDRDDHKADRGQPGCCISYGLRHSEGDRCRHRAAASERTTRSRNRVPSLKTHENRPRWIGAVVKQPLERNGPRSRTERR